MIGWSGSTTFVSNSPVPCLWNWAPTRAMYFGRVQEAERGAVQRDEAAAVRDVVEQRLLLVLADLRRVGVDRPARRTCRASRRSGPRSSRCRSSRSRGPPAPGRAARSDRPADAGRGPPGTARPAASPSARADRRRGRRDRKARAARSDKGGQAGSEPHRCGFPRDASRPTEPRTDARPTLANLCEPDASPTPG